MICYVVRRLRLRAEATRVACIAGLRCVAAIFASLRCRWACWRLDANVLCGRASACSFAMLVLRCPAIKINANERKATWRRGHVHYVHRGVAVCHAGASLPSEREGSASFIARQRIIGLFAVLYCTF